MWSHCFGKTCQVHIWDAKEWWGASAFRLADLANMYDRRAQQLSVHSKPIHRTRLKEMLMKKVPDLQAYTKGRDLLYCWFFKRRRSGNSFGMFILWHNAPGFRNINTTRKSSGRTLFVWRINKSICITERTFHYSCSRHHQSQSEFHNFKIIVSRYWNFYYPKPARKWLWNWTQPFNAWERNKVKASVLSSRFIQKCKTCIYLKQTTPSKVCRNDSKVARSWLSRGKLI